MSTFDISGSLTKSCGLFGPATDDSILSNSKSILLLNFIFLLIPSLINFAVLNIFLLNQYVYFFLPLTLNN